MLTDLIAASAEDATVIPHTPGHANIWPTLEVSGVEPTQWASLRLILKQQALPGAMDAAPVALSHAMQDFERVGPAGEQGDPWLVALPEELGTLLAQLSEDQFPALARAWLTAEAERRPHWEAEALEFLVADLAAFAATAVAQGHRLFLWICP
ncbi:hypothetical protein LNV23_05135 [Paucibacter sp. DJ1R-11]|uniref:hypothetical protein n=1 Tax=Paucibacter sp. DJ1R-11 TaxID=2893556 RepID=UPI0021E465B3|nr:hypothetical protein [Paucibacter sp. DJ1R-11]MCV2362833.1 hypothetical protein [Paucibacter sp. DJ1R-11]